MLIKLQGTSLRTQLTLLIFSAGLIVLLLTSTVFVYWKVADARNEARHISQTAVAILAQDFVRSILLHKPDIAVDMASKIDAFALITNAVFLTRDHKPIMVYNRPGHTRISDVPPRPEQVDIAGNSINVYMPIVYQGKTYGLAYFRFSHKLFNPEFIAFIKRLALTLPILLLLIIPLALFLQRVISRPIRQLAGALAEVGEGNVAVMPESDARSLEIHTLFHGFNTMVSRIALTQRQLGEQKERLLVTLESIADGVIATDDKGVITYMNPTAETISGWDETSAIGQNAEQVYRLIDENSDKQLSGYIDETLLSGTVHFSLENTALLTRDDQVVPVQSSISPIRHQHRVIGCVIIFQNVTEHRQLSNQLRHQATHDTLTNLINRSEFERLLTRALENKSNHEHHSLLYLDLDQFKIVNDTSGHVAGDVLLQQIAVLLQKTVRETDVVARLGGDEFAVFLPHCMIDQASEIGEKIRQAINEFIFIWEDRQFRIGVCIGAVEINSAGRDFSDLMRAADLSCYAAKDHGRNRIHIYREEDQELIERHSEMQWVERLQKGLSNNRFILYGQYIQSLNPLHQSEHLEILIRYLDRFGNIIPPGAFLPAAERYNLVPGLDEWVLESVLANDRLVALLHSNPRLRVNINLSGLTLGDAKMSDAITQLIRTHQLSPGSLCFEITETAAVADLAATSHFIRSLRQLGCEFALDDFGIGVSSFAYLKNLPVDYLKIDGSFVHDIDCNPVNAAMVSAINQIGHVMNIRTVAEFVENEAVLAKLRELGVDYAQGYHVHTPCALNDIYPVIDAAHARVVLDSVN
ncbi:MAG: EAL domain-containing protein [Gammaproteobacteria bacterium]